eukprot:TRINITY_DN5482_c0_g1_i3.p1 TRINITY_DN5482_c0_g1~~TRINITY_DN5482_c0_g1_i3.p1  ORF type:complete len:129 (-),score=32.49 TRINITY_DN5482_c0_g1_i3:104-490(-)
MFSKLLKEHQAKQSVIREENERLRKVAVNSVPPVTSGLVDSVNGGVAAVFANQRKLEAEARNLQQNANRFAKQTQQWVTLLEGFNTSLKEIGDIENWAKTIEQDMLSIASSLEYVYKTQTQTPPEQPK